MTEVIKTLMDDADAAALARKEETGVAPRLVEANCPLCKAAVPTHELATHVGSFHCSSLMVDQAIMDVIEVDEYKPET